MRQLSGPKCCPKRKRAVSKFARLWSCLRCRFHRPNCKPNHRLTRINMSTVDAGLETQLRNIEEKYGKSLSEWVTIIRNSGKTKHTEIVAMLKSQYGMAH